uniref:Flavin reductase family protein n=1 Tax=Janibacter limosus TaxID=53458 RepID=A0AC61U6K1_9MICO|nr:flavin reductase family protein [Janibacter limosus]
MSGARPTSLRHAMAHFATGVTVVTTLEDGHDHAMTANSVTSVSLDPRSSWSASSRTAAGMMLWSRRACGVSRSCRSGRDRRRPWLSTGGRPLYGQLSGIAHHRGELGVALVDDALATLECRTTALHEAGDHTIVVGEVLSSLADARRDDPLIYYRSRYTSTR